METRGDVPKWGLWERQTDAIIGIKFGDFDADTYEHESMYKLLDGWYNQNKDNHGKHYHKQRTRFSLFVLSIDGMLGKEALVVLANSIQLVAAKMDEPILHMKGWINS